MIAQRASISSQLTTSAALTVEVKTVNISAKGRKKEITRFLELKP